MGFDMTNRHNENYKQQIDELFAYERNAPTAAQREAARVEIVRLRRLQASVVNQQSGDAVLKHGERSTRPNNHGERDIIAENQRTMDEFRREGKQVRLQDGQWQDSKSPARSYHGKVIDTNHPTLGPDVVPTPATSVARAAPRFEDFGLTAITYKRVQGRPIQAAAERIGFATTIVGAIAVTAIRATIVAPIEIVQTFFGSLVGVGICCAITSAIVVQAGESWNPSYRKGRQYDAAVVEWRRTLHEHWMSLNGRQFEHELASLYERLGFSATRTGGSGDGGVDIVLRMPSQLVIVQCKAHNRPVGPAVAREMFGALTHFGADRAIIACTSGFTSGTRDFVRGKPIELLSANDIVRLASGV